MQNFITFVKLVHFFVNLFCTVFYSLFLRQASVTKLNKLFILGLRFVFLL